MLPIILLGQTAVGKTKLSIELAKQINGEIISADSMQVYRGMDIGTAKPTIEERQGIPHHLIDIKNPDEEWTVSDFIGEAQTSNFKLQNKGKMPIIVGGTGLYLWALIEGFSFPIIEANKEIRAKLESVPTAALYSRLSTVDPKACEKIHANDKKRIIRALEVYELTGKPISELQKKNPLSRSPSLSASNPLPLNKGEKKRGYTLIGLTLPKDTLYARINARVDSMIAKGLIEEVQGLLQKGYPKDLKSFQALGYKEVIDYLDGRGTKDEGRKTRDEERKTKDEMIEELKKRTRNFAKRQMTWFKRFKDVSWIDAEDQKEALSQLKLLAYKP